MASLKGRYDAKVDSKGRVSIPSKCRKLLPEQLVIGKHPSKDIPALVVYTDEDFNAWFERLLESKGGAKANSEVQDVLEDEFFQDAVDVEIDDIGRITIPLDLRKHAGIEKSTIITGARNHLIIRTPEMWEKSRELFASNQVYDQPAAVTT